MDCTSERFAKRKRPRAANCLHAAGARRSFQVGSVLAVHPEVRQDEVQVGEVHRTVVVQIAEAGVRAEVREDRVQVAQIGDAVEVGIGGAHKPDPDPVALVDHSRHQWGGRRVADDLIEAAGPIVGTCRDDLEGFGAGSRIAIRNEISRVPSSATAELLSNRSDAPSSLSSQAKVEPSPSATGRVAAIVPTLNPGASVPLTSVSASMRPLPLSVWPAPSVNNSPAAFSSRPRRRATEQDAAGSSDPRVSQCVQRCDRSGIRRVDAEQTVVCEDAAADRQCSPGNEVESPSITTESNVFVSIEISEPAHRYCELFRRASWCSRTRPSHRPLRSDRHRSGRT